MKYWLCITTEENWNVIREKLVWGVSEKFKNTLQKVKPGDKLLIYVMQTKKNDKTIPSRIVAAYEATSEPYKDSTRIFKTYKGETTFPYRVKLKEIKIFEKPIPFKELVPQLDFIKNKKYWTGSIRRAMREIPEKDYERILNISEY